MYQVGNFSHESVRLWYNALNKILPKPEKYRRCIAIERKRKSEDEKDHNENILSYA